MRRTGTDDGSVLLLVLGMGALLLVLVGVVVDVSVALLARRSLVSAADGAAVSAAQALDQQALYDRGLAAGVPLSPSGVADRVAAYERVAAPGQPGLRLESDVEGGVTAVVVAQRTVRLPFSALLGRGPVEVVAVARARSPLTGAPS